MSAVTWGCTAYRHACWTLVIGMSNQPSRVEETGGWSKTSTLLARRKSHQWVKRDQHWVMTAPRAKYETEGDTTHEKTLDRAKRAAQYRAGNCGEHAAVVYAYLWEKARDKRIGLVSRVSCKKPGDHAFVVIGRDPFGDGSVNSWGPAAVVVDAWGRCVCDGLAVAGETGEYWEGEEEGIVRIQEYINHYDTRVICEFDTGA